jgi:uncharacterized membrane protein
LQNSDEDARNRGAILCVRSMRIASLPLARRLGQSPRQQIREDLRRFKQVKETGETATIEGQPHGRSG